MGETMAAVYGGGPFYTGGKTVMDDLKGSGFTTVVAWSVHVNSSGDLIYNDPTIVSGGKYTGESAWPGQLADLKQGGSVDRLLFSVGSGGTSDFSTIQKLIQQDGSGPDSILYKNFQALKDAIPGIDGIDFDDEDLFDQSTIVTFALMLKAIGYGQVTFCPYMMPDFWVDCLAAIDAQAAGFVSGFNLQCYSGGAGNDPANWISTIKKKMGGGFDAEGFVFPGLWCRHTLPDTPACSEGMCPTPMKNQFQTWKPDGIRGGFVWLYDDIQKCENSGVCGESMSTAAYAGAIINAL